MIPPKPKLGVSEWETCPKCNARWKLTKFAGHGYVPEPSPPNPVRYQVRGLDKGVLLESCWKCGYSFERQCHDSDRIHAED